MLHGSGTRVGKVGLLQLATRLGSLGVSPVTIDTMKLMLRLIRVYQ